MGKILNGILGGVSGKVAGVVGGSWKGINYIRGYLIPADPQTPAQEAQRLKMIQVNNIARYALSPIIQPFWDPFYSNKAGIHGFLSANLLRWNTPDDYSQALLAQGQLEPLITQGCEYNSATGLLYMSWYSTYEGNGLPTDNVMCFWYDESAVYGGPGIGGRTRDDFFMYVDIGIDRNANNLHAFMFAYRGVAPSLEVSNSIHDIVIPDA